MWKNNGMTEGYRRLPNLADNVMLQYRFKQIMTHVPFMWADEEKRENGDPWWQVEGLMEAFNK